MQTSTAPLMMPTVPMPLSGTLWTCFLTLATLTAQATDRPPVPTQTQPQNGWLPFRNPDKNYEPPQDLYKDLRIMRRIAENPGAAQVSYDEDGREVVDDPVFAQTRESIKSKVPRIGGYLGNVVWDSANVDDRDVALYGIFWLDNVASTIELIPLIPGEPSATLRTKYLTRAAEFLRRHLVKKDDKGAPLYQLNLEPFVALLDQKMANDQAQGLWFLTQVVTQRPDWHKTLLEQTQARLPALVQHADATVREHARAFVQAADPKRRPVPPDGVESTDAQAWLEAILYEVLPPIRVISSGLIDLYPSKDRDELVRVGRDVLSRDAIGVMTHGQLRDGLHYRGLRLARLPSPLDKLQVPKDAIVTHVAGKPVTGSQEMLELIESALNSKPKVMIEFVDQGVVKAVEYRIVTK